MPQNRPNNYNWSNIDRSRAATRLRQEAAYTLRQNGVSYIEIARQLGYVDALGNPKAQSAAEAVRAVARRMALGNSTTTDYSVANGEFPMLPSNRTFGFEAEFFGITPTEATAALAAIGITAPYVGYNHDVSTNTVSGWKLVYDQSVNGRGTGLGRGMELVSPVLRGEEGLVLAAKAVNALQNAGGKTDKTCGLHIHIGMDGLTGKQIVKTLDLYSANQEHINKLIARSRWTNIYCQPMDRYTRNSNTVVAFENADSASDTRRLRPTLSHYDRYHAVNLASYAKYGTVEFRQHQGTLNGEKVTSWVKFLMAMVEKSVTMDTATDLTSLDGLLNGLPLHSETRTFLTRRAERLERSRDEARARATSN